MSPAPHATTVAKAERHLNRALTQLHLAEGLKPEARLERLRECRFEVLQAVSQLERVLALAATLEWVSSQ